MGCLAKIKVMTKLQELTMPVLEIVPNITLRKIATFLFLHIVQIKHTRHYPFIRELGFLTQVCCVPLHPGFMLC